MATHTRAHRRVAVYWKPGRHRQSVLLPRWSEELIDEIRDEGRSDYVWTVTGSAAGKCRVTIIHTGYGIKDSSDAFFAIGSSPY